MIIKTIKDLVNARLAGEQLTYSALKPYLDAVVDEINSSLHAEFKTFSEVSSLDPQVDYAEFPDKYIRTVVVIGAAAKWYIDDEEGIETAQALMQQYKNNLFIMVRDYGPLVPEEKRANANTGFLVGENCRTANGINPEIRYVEVPGLPGTSITNLQIKALVDGSRHLIATLVDYVNGTKVIDCGIVSPEIVTIKIDAAGYFVALMSDGTVHKMGKIPGGTGSGSGIRVAINEPLPPGTKYSEVALCVEDY